MHNFFCSMTTLFRFSNIYMHDSYFTDFNPRKTNESYLVKNDQI